MQVLFIFIFIFIIHGGTLGSVFYYYNSMLGIID